MVDQPSTSWKLAPPHAANVQGLIVSPFAHLSLAQALLLDTSRAPGSAWLYDLLNGDNALTITPATGKALDDSGAETGCTAIAFTVTGLKQLGLDDETLGSFATPFTEGMHEANRRNRLGDTRLEPPDRKGRPLWGANVPPLPGDEDDPDYAVCDKTVHAAVLLYHKDEATLNAFAAPVRDKLAKSGVEITYSLDLSLKFDENDPPIAREHFGFADGISQPVPHDAKYILPGTAPGTPSDKVHGIAGGDILFGLADANQEVLPGAIVNPSLPGAAVLPAVPPNGSDGSANADPDQRSLGLDGTYLVMRQLSQDPDRFWNSMRQAAEQLGDKTADWVAERVVGRTKDGVILAKDPPPATKGGPGNDFLFLADDPDARYCPFGSHIRRANPRDGLAPSAGDAETILHAANNHRILRRGRKYEAVEVPGAGTLPGLLFICLNTDLERQFEFVQQTWMLNPSFAALIDETDPLVGPQGKFSIQAYPLRLLPDVDTFIRFIGGEYFFMPSLPALTYLAGLPHQADAAP
jgi:deferrochelatase/peroxidase EfeB